MADDFVERYADVLQNIEFAIVETYRRMPHLLDYHVDSALEAAIGVYSAEQQGRAPRIIGLEGERLAVHEAVRNVCEWRLGRGDLAVGRDTRGGEPLPPKTVGEIVDCLKRTRKSAQRLTRQGGRQGYLNFVVRYIR